MSIQTLTIEQQKVVDLSYGQHLVLAPPGTGKTDMLSIRIVKAIEQRIDQKKMLCVTFTNRAAKEMKTRVEDLVAKHEIFIGSLHSFCFDYLKKNHILDNSHFLLDNLEAEGIKNEAKKYATQKVLQTLNDDITSSLESRKDNWKRDFQDPFATFTVRDFDDFLKWFQDKGLNIEKKVLNYYISENTFVKKHAITSNLDPIKFR